MHDRRPAYETTAHVRGGVLMQTHDRVSDEEAKALADYDLRWKVALEKEVDERPWFRSMLAATVANLTEVAKRTEQNGSEDKRIPLFVFGHLGLRQVDLESFDAA